MNNGFWDLPVEIRGHYYDRAEEENGCSFHDLPAEVRGYYYDLAAEENSGYMYEEVDTR